MWSCVLGSYTHELRRCWLENILDYISGPHPHLTSAPRQHTVTMQHCSTARLLSLQYKKCHCSSWSAIICNTMCRGCNNVPSNGIHPSSSCFTGTLRCLWNEVVERDQQIHCIHHTYRVSKKTGISKNMAITTLKSIRKGKNLCVLENSA